MPSAIDPRPPSAHTPDPPGSHRDGQVPQPCSARLGTLVPLTVAAGPRVRLAVVSVGDAAALIAANREARAAHAPWVAPFTDQPGFDAWFAGMVIGPGQRLVARDSEGALVGVVNLNEIVLGAFRSCYLGWYGYPDAAGRGLMTEAVGLALDYAFGALGLHRAEANIQPANAPSLALARRLGFRREGMSPAYLHIDGAWRDHERWAILATDWMAGR